MGYYNPTPPLCLMPVVHTSLSIVGSYIYIWCLLPTQTCVIMTCYNCVWCLWPTQTCVIITYYDSVWCLWPTQTWVLVWPAVIVSGAYGLQCYYNLLYLCLVPVAHTALLWAAIIVSGACGPHKPMLWSAIIVSGAIYIYIYYWNMTLSGILSRSAAKNQIACICLFKNNCADYIQCSSSLLCHPSEHQDWTVPVPHTNLCCYGLL